MKSVWMLSAWLVLGADAFAEGSPTVVVDSSPSALSVPSAAPVPAAVDRRLPAGSLVELELTEPVASSRNHRGDMFGLRVVENVSVDGVLLIPAGSLGTGQVVHAAASQGGGKPGELLLAARTIDVQGRRIPLRGMKLGASGKDNIGLAAGMAVAMGPFAMFIRGREIEIPAGTRANAKLAQKLSFDAPAFYKPEEPSTAANPMAAPNAVETSMSSSTPE